METTLYDLKDKRVWVAGHRGMVGSALVRRLAAVRCEILTIDRAALDLRRQRDVEEWVAHNRPDAIFVAAATVGGISANAARPGEFIYDNIAIATNIIDAAHRADVGKLMFLGSACIYPRLAEQPMRETSYLTGPLEPTNEAYAIAKIAGIGLCQSYRRQYGRDFISVIPTNLYGPGDNLDPAQSHVVPALIRRVLEAKAKNGLVEIWGTGTPRREFLFVDDAADALVFLMERYSAPEVINVGSGTTISIRELAAAVADALHFRGQFDYDTTKLDGMPHKQLDAKMLLALGWQPVTSLDEGLATTCRWVAEALSSGA